MFGLKGSADIVQRFGMTDKQIPAGKKIIIKCIDNMLFHGIVKINDNISAEHDMRTVNSGKLVGTGKVDLSELNKLLRCRNNSIIFAFLDKIFGS